MKLSAKIFSAVACAALVIAMFPAAALARSNDAVVTIGADLTASQRSQVLSFFGLDESDLQNMDVITVTNADEHAYCDATIPSSVIGNQTLSCSYIQPTNSGGIRVRTANLNYVTSDVLYNALQTAGIQNCNLVVTAPCEVSGTGALTGVFMAYESTGNTLDTNRAEAAIEEMYTTAGLVSEYGDDMAEVIGEVKDEVISSAADLTYDQIVQIIKDKCAEHGITITDEDIAAIANLVQRLQSMGLSADSFAATLSKLGGISGLIDSIVSFFSGLFGGGSILSGLDTSVFSLDR